MQSTIKISSKDPGLRRIGGHTFSFDFHHVNMLVWLQREWKRPEYKGFFCKRPVRSHNLQAPLVATEANRCEPSLACLLCGDGT